MRKILIAATTAAAFCTAPAFAADMPVKAPPMMAAPASNWTGCYVGGNAGGAWSRKDTATTIINSASDERDAGKTHLDGWAAGGQVGCDYQVNNVWVFGIRGMWDGSDLKGSNDWPSTTFVFNRYKIDGFGTVVATLGYLLNPTLELYGLGGVAWVRDHLVWTQPGLGLGDDFASSSHTRTGYDVGVGIAWMFAPHWDLFVEYDHMGFGTKNQSLTGIGAGAGFTYAGNIKQDVDKVLVGLNYRFDAWGKAPVVAKY